MRQNTFNEYRIRNLQMNHVKVLVDTREKHPWLLEPMITEITTLETGDYSSACRRHIIERKSSTDELISCMTHSRDRFERELERMQTFDSAIVVVESPYDELASGNYRSKMNENAALATLIAWEQRYGIPFNFCGNRTQAERFARHYFHLQLRRRLREIHDTLRTWDKAGMKNLTQTIETEFQLVDQGQTC